MDIINTTNLDSITITDVIVDGIPYKRVEYLRKGKSVDIQWSKTHIGNINFDDLVEDELSNKLEIQYKKINNFNN